MTAPCSGARGHFFFGRIPVLKTRQTLGKRLQIASTSLAIKLSLSLSLPPNREAAVVAIVANGSVFEY